MDISKIFDNVDVLKIQSWIVIHFNTW